MMKPVANSTVAAPMSGSASSRAPASQQAQRLEQPLSVPRSSSCAPRSWPRRSGPAGAPVPTPGSSGPDLQPAATAVAAMAEPGDGTRIQQQRREQQRHRQPLQLLCAGAEHERHRRPDHQEQQLPFQVRESWPHSWLATEIEADVTMIRPNSTIARPTQRHRVDAQDPPAARSGRRPSMSGDGAAHAASSRTAC